MHKKLRRAAALSGLLAFTPGCWLVSTAVDSAVSTAVHRETEAQSRRASNAMMAAYSPMLMQAYASAMLSMAFHSGGYAWNEGAYKPGQYTRWAVVSQGEGGKHPMVERAFLRTDAEGNQWWKVKLTEPEEGQTAVLEALFSPDRSSLLRLRARFPGETEGKELPVEEGSYYVAPRALTKYSLEGALKGSTQVSTPAGSFRAKHYVFGDAAGGTHEWYAAPEVPGGSVKFVARAAGTAPSEGSSAPDASNYELTLSAFGEGAVSELGVP